MIRIDDTVKLAITKLRTRKVRHIITIVISGLLFSSLVFAAVVSRGLFVSTEAFSKEGLGKRFIIQAIPLVNNSLYNDKSVMDRATAIHKDTVAKKKLEAKKLGIEYDAVQDASPIQEYDSPTGKAAYLNFIHPAAQIAVQEWAAAHPAASLAELQTKSTAYNPIAFYQHRQLQMNSSMQITHLKDGKENLLETTNKSEPSPLSSFTESWLAIDEQLLQPFLLPGQNLQKGSDGSIPIIANYDAIENILKLNPLPATASSAERLARVTEVRKRATTLTFDMCYRNATSAALANQAVSTQQEMERNKSNKTYQKPELIYGVPADPCGAVAISRDVRSAEVKKLAQKQEQFDQTFGAVPAQQKTIKFRVVGMTPSPFQQNASDVTQIISSLVNSSLGNGWFMPTDIQKQDELIAKLFAQDNYILGNGVAYYAEFASGTHMRDFITKESCTPDFTNSQVDPFAKCMASGKNFSLMLFGNNSLGIESAQRDFNNFFRYAMLIAAAIACVIMSGTVGKMIADSRRETAVFRAIGAKRLDISQIYILYAVLLSGLIASFAVVAGISAALLVHTLYSPGFTLNAIVAYNTQDLSRVFHLYSLQLSDILPLVGLIIGSGVVSTIVPLIRNVRRNPIRDMRDE